MSLRTNISLVHKDSMIVLFFRITRSYGVCATFLDQFISTIQRTIMPSRKIFTENIQAVQAN